MKKMKKLLAVLLSLTMFISVCPMMAMAETENEYTVAWIGGSFTEGQAGGLLDKCFVKLVTDWMNETDYAGADTIKCINAGVGGTTSDYGRMRYEKDVLAHNPDLVIIEFAGNDSIHGDYNTVMLAMESMIRRTIANNPKTKIAILLRPYWSEDGTARQTAMEYHKLVAEYYNVPVIDTAATVPADPDWALDDNSHPNEIGHAKIAEGIINWFEENTVNYPMNKQFPMNPNYTPIVPVYKNAADLYVSEESTGWSVEDGVLVSDGTIGAKLTLNIKGTAFSFPKTSGSAGSSPYSVDGYMVDESGTQKQGSRKRGYIAGGGNCQGTELEMGEGEHKVQITTNSANVLKLNKIIVDGLAYGEAETTETLNYEVFHDTLESKVEGTPSRTGLVTNGGGVVYDEVDYAWMNGLGDVKGLGLKTKSAYIKYDLKDTTKDIGSVYVSFGSYGVTEESDNLKVYATNAEGIDTEIPVIGAVKDTGYGVVANQACAIVDYIGYNIPSDTVAIKVMKRDIAGGTGERFLDVKYTYADPVMEGITINTTETAFEGETYPIEVVGNMSNGEAADLTNADVAVYPSDSEVVSVDMTTGTITATGAGTAVIYAEAIINGKLYENEMKIRVYGADEFDEIYFETDKLNYTEGTSGKIDFVTVSDGVKEIDKFNVSYTSSNTSVLTVENDGTFTAVSEGSATITPVVSAIDKDFEPITINVLAPKEISSYLQEDITNGKLKASMLKILDGTATNNVFTLSSHRNGSKLFGATYLGALIGALPYVHNYTTTAYDNMYMAFVYKLDGELESLYADAETWNTLANMQKRFQIAYLTDDTVTFKQDSSDMTITNPALTGYGLRNLVTVDAENGAKKLNPVWTEDTKLTWTSKATAGSPTKTPATSTNIPKGAKYALVLVNSGLLEDGTAAIRPDHFHFAGVKFTYKTAIAADEITPDGRIALTYNGDIADAAVTVKVNGEVVAADVTYDAETFTSYIDADYHTGDTITVTVDGIGEYEDTIEDTREQVAEISVKNQDGEDMTSLIMGQTGVSVTAKIENSNDEKAQLFIVYYKGDKLEKVAYKAVDITDGVAEISDSLTFDEAAEGSKLSVFLWNENLAPFANYKDIQTLFEMDDF